MTGQRTTFPSIRTRQPATEVIHTWACPGVVLSRVHEGGGGVVPLSLKNAHRQLGRAAARSRSVKYKKRQVSGVNDCQKYLLSSVVQKGHLQYTCSTTKHAQQVLRILHVKMVRPRTRCAPSTAFDAFGVFRSLADGRVTVDTLRVHCVIACDTTRHTGTSLCQTTCIEYS